MTRRHVRHIGLPHHRPIILDPQRIHPMPRQRPLWNDALWGLGLLALVAGIGWGAVALVVVLVARAVGL